MSRLARRKVVQSDLSTEGSETAKTCTDAQEVHTEAGKGGVSNHSFAKPEISILFL